MCFKGLIYFRHPPVLETNSKDEWKHKLLLCYVILEDLMAVMMTCVLESCGLVGLHGSLTRKGNSIILRHEFTSCTLCKKCITRIFRIKLVLRACTGLHNCFFHMLGLVIIFLQEFRYFPFTFSYKEYIHL